MNASSVSGWLDLAIWDQLMLAILKSLSADFHKSSQFSCWTHVILLFEMLKYRYSVEHPYGCSNKGSCPKEVYYTCNIHSVGIALDHQDSKDSGELGLMVCSLWFWASSNRAAPWCKIVLFHCSFCKSKLSLLIEDKYMCAKAYATYANAFPSSYLETKMLVFRDLSPFSMSVLLFWHQEEWDCAKRARHVLFGESNSSEQGMLQTTELEQENFYDNSRAKTLLSKPCCHFYVDVSQLWDILLAVLQHHMWQILRICCPKSSSGTGFWLLVCLQVY